MDRQDSETQASPMQSLQLQEQGKSSPWYLYSCKSFLVDKSFVRQWQAAERAQSAEEDTRTKVIPGKQCCITNYLNTQRLKIVTFIISRFPQVRNQIMHQFGSLRQGLSQGSDQAVQCTAIISSLNWEKISFQARQAFHL